MPSPDGAWNKRIKRAIVLCSRIFAVYAPIATAYEFIVNGKLSWVPITTKLGLFAVLINMSHLAGILLFAWIGFFAIAGIGLLVLIFALLYALYIIFVTVFFIVWEISGRSEKLADFASTVVGSTAKAVKNAGPAFFWCMAVGTGAAALVRAVQMGGNPLSPITANFDFADWLFTVSGGSVLFFIYYAIFRKVRRVLREEEKEG